MSHDLMVFSHLRWDFVYQRPQHLISRLARRYRVFFIEEPIYTPGREAHWQHSEPEPNVQVWRPCTPIEQPGFDDAQMETLKSLVKQLLVSQRIDQPVAWFYTPMALPLLALTQARLTVYDCMDELSAFAMAPPQLIERESQLLQRADVVFTGGPSLYAAKRDRHPNVYCFPSSVDAAHFGKARQNGPEPEDQQAIPGPKLGFFGVIDERIDRDVLDALGQSNPDWQFVMVGPVVKIDPASLPQTPNLHYLGQRSYDQLPDYLRGWDVCLLPFARNDATRFISPTKTLEYMAARKPIVSTPITDVAEPYGHIVYLGDTPQAFVQACTAALQEDAGERKRRAADMQQVLASTSWDTTAETMHEKIEAALQTKYRTASPVTRQSELPRQKPVAVIGAGPTGLSAAYHLGDDAVLIEQHQQVGGWCRSVYDRGFTFDMAGHIMFSKDPYVHEMYKILLGDNVHWQDREAWIYSKQVYTRYPFQGCLYGLPADVITECIVGAVEARFGPVGKDKALEDTVSQAARGNGHTPAISPDGNGHRSARQAANHRCNVDGQPDGQRDGQLQDCCGDGVLEAETTLVERRMLDGQPPGPPPNTPPNTPLGTPTTENFEQFIYRVWGKGIARHFAIPYNRKLWAVPLKEMETSWLGGRVPMPDLEEMIRYALTPAAKPMGPNARFGYPLRGGFQALMDGFIPYVEENLQLGTAIERIDPAGHTLYTRTGQQLTYDQLISTMPLPALIRCMGDQVPQDVRQAVARLRSVSVRCVNLGIGRENITDKHWIYYPEDTIFHRIFVQGNASPHCNPPGGFGLTCEISYSPAKPLPVQGDALIQRCIDDCVRVGMIKKDDPIWCANQVDMPGAYVIYDHQRAANVQRIRDWLATQDIILAGRYSEWEYFNSDHAFIAGKHAAEQARARLQQSRAGKAV